MSNPAALGAITYATESSWGENVSTFATFRLPIIGMVDASGLKHPKQHAGRTVQYRNDGTLPILMVQGGTFKTKLYLTGHGSSCSGAVSLSATETLLQYVFGNAAVASSNGTTTTGGTASVPITAAASGFSAGSMCRIGAIGDARGNGQFAAISTHSGSNLNLLTAIDASPNSGDVVYAPTMLYPSETPTTTSVTGLRFLLQTANLCYECHGCYPSAITFAGLNTGELPTIDVTWVVSWWAYSTATFPSTVSTDLFQPTANAGGSMFANTNGTTTRAKLTNRSFQLSWKLGMESLMGPGGAVNYQAIVGARRLPDVIDLRFMIDADAQTNTPVLDGYATGTNKFHVLYTLSTTNGSAVGFYFPNVAFNDRSLQKIDKNINRYEFVGQAQCSATTTSDLTLSAARIAFA